MSTISDALKKKRDEEEEPSPETAGPRVVEVHVPKDRTTRNALLIAFIGALVLTGVAIGGYALFGRMAPSGRRPAATPPSTDADQAPVAPETTQRDTATTQPDTTATEPTAGLILQGVFPDPIDPRAVISGRRLKLGDTIEGFTVIAIEADGVVLERTGKRYKLPTN